MANTVNIDAGLTVSDGCGTKQVRRSASLSLTGTKYFADRQSIGTSEATISIGACASLRYISIINPSTNSATLTVTASPMVLRPGDPAVFPLGDTVVTIQSTGASTEFSVGGVEN